jgi:hypothetical protein
MRRKPVALRYLRVDMSLDWRLSGDVGSLPPRSAEGTAAIKPAY